MEDGIVKAENEIVLPEGVADNVVNIVVAREPQKKSFIETGMYASYLLIQMGSMLVNALNGDVLMQDYLIHVLLRIGNTRNANLLFLLIKKVILHLEYIIPSLSPDAAKTIDSAMI